MAELSKNKARISTQDRPVYRRDGILPNQMGPGDSPQRRDNIDVRAARRGTAGADAVMRLAQQVNDTFAQVAEYKQQQYIYDEQNNAFKAVGDQRRGTPDEGLMNDSIAYKAAFSLSQVNAEMADAKQRMLKRAQGVIDSYKGADEEELLGLVKGVVDEELKGVVLDENGKVRDFGTARAYATAANRVGKLTEDTLADAQTLGRKRIQTNGRNMEVTRAVAELRATGTIDIHTFTENISKYGLSEADAEGALIDSLEIIAKEDPAKADAVLRQLGGIPGTVKEARGQIATSTAPVKLAPTGRPPVQGTVTSRLGDGRNHNGIDIDARIGDPVEAPAGGKVIKVDTNPNQRAGIHVVIDHGNGVTSSYSHLSAVDVQEGMTIRPGQKIAKVGNTGNVKKGPNGDGSHLHWVVRQDKKMVDPLNFQFPEYVGEVSISQVAAVTPEEKPLATLITPPGFQLSAEGMARVASLRETTTERARIMADRAESERHQLNAEALYKDILAGSYPSDQRLTELADKGEISYDMAVNFRTMRINKEKGDRAEADYLEDRARRDRNEAADTWTANIAMSWRVDGAPKNMAEFNTWVRQNSGKLGEGTNWVQNYNMLLGVVGSEQSKTTGDPEYRSYDAQLKNLFGGRQSALGRTLGVNNDPNAALRARDRFRYLVVTEGKHPSEAYHQVAKENGLQAKAGAASDLTKVDADLEELARRRNQ